jgi:SAM-dependent methyltransferase
MSKAGMTEQERTSAYLELLKDGGASYMGVGWKPEECLGQYAAMRRLLRIPPGARILDIGCGLGFGYNVYYDCAFDGIDCSHTHVGAAKQIFYGSRAKFEHRGSKEEIPSGKYDFILLSGIFNVGYTWKEAASLVTDAYKAADRGIGVAFMVGRAEGMTTFGIQTWVGLMTKLTGEPTGWAADTQFSEINAVVTAAKPQETLT